MGLGKTVQGCALLRCYQADWPALIITPSSLREQWADALHQVGRLTDESLNLEGHVCGLQARFSMNGLKSQHRT